MANLTPITNDIDLLRIVGNDLKLVIDDVADWLVKRIQESIMDNVYDIPQPADSPYERLGLNGGFLGAWEAEASSFVGNYITNLIAMDWKLMKYNGENLQHGNEAVDRRQYMDSLIAEGSGWDIGGNAMLARDYWSEIVRIVETGELDSVLERFMTAYGISFMRVL